MRLLLLFGIVVTARSQVLDDFQCPDEFIGYYPHLISCDKYWYCEDGIPELRTCGNGLAFIDEGENTLEPTYSLEQCEEYHLVECGERTELEPAIPGGPNCPRLFGTYPDIEDCGVFWKCLDGKATQTSCPPGLAWDTEKHVCTWADEVPECSTNEIVVDEQGEVFTCPLKYSAGVYTKHANPASCRDYFLCIDGTPREYGCPEGTVFYDPTGLGNEGKCISPEDDPTNCKYYYDDTGIEAKKSGYNINSGNNNQREDGDRSVSRPRARSGASSFSRNTIRTNDIEKEAAPAREISRDSSRPAPPLLQAIVDSSRVSPSRSRPSRPQSRQPSPVRSEEPAKLPSRLSTNSAPKRPSRLQIITDRPRDKTTQAPQTTKSRLNTGSRFSPASRPSFNSGVTKASEPATAAPIARNIIEETAAKEGEGLPPPKKAAPGPDGQEYYYYYYYYDDEEGPEGEEGTPDVNNSVKETSETGGSGLGAGLGQGLRPGRG